MDPLSRLFAHPRAQGVFALLMTMRGPWAIDVADRAALTVLVVTAGRLVVRAGTASPTLSAGDIAACLAWAGDIVQLRMDNDDIAFAVLDRGYLFGTDDLYALFALTSRSFAIAGSVAPYLSGAGYEVFGTFQPEFVTAGVVALVAACIFTGTATVVTGED